VVPKRGKALVKTDLAMIIDPSVYGRIAPRSGLAWKHSIDVGAGVIDSDYRGNIGIVLFNHGDDDFIIGKGDRVAQLIFEKIQMVGFAEVDDELEETNRASGGFGSTGK
jgi:dUTP pyrophosphatase